MSCRRPAGFRFYSFCICPKTQVLMSSYLYNYYLVWCVMEKNSPFMTAILGQTPMNIERTPTDIQRAPLGLRPISSGRRSDSDRSPAGAARSPTDSNSSAGDRPISQRRPGGHRPVTGRRPSGDRSSACRLGALISYLNRSAATARLVRRPTGDRPGAGRVVGGE